MTDLAALIQAGRDLEKDGSEAQAIAYFQQLVAQYPDDAAVQYETGGAYDFAGQEAAAIPHYERAIALGLGGEDAPRVRLQLGSSLRNVGRHDEAAALLDEACQQYPDYLPLKAFYALALYSAGQSEKAVPLLLGALLLQPEALDGYGRALSYYVDEIKDSGA
jgi:tetratricopeptide (TPR) repeat protein